MILPAHDLTISDGDRFRAMFTDPDTAQQRLEAAAETLGIDFYNTPSTQALDCLRVMCDVLIKEQREVAT